MDSCLQINQDEIEHKKDRLAKFAKLGKSLYALHLHKLFRFTFLQILHVMEILT